MIEGGNIISPEIDKLIVYHHWGCKDVGLIIFGFTLQEVQIDALYTLFYKDKDFLLLTKIGFGKNFMF